MTLKCIMLSVENLLIKLNTYDSTPIKFWKMQNCRDEEKISGCWIEG